MLVSLAIVLLALWLLGIAVSYTVGGLIHLLLVLAIISLAYHFITNTVVGDDSRHAPSL